MSTNSATLSGGDQNVVDFEKLKKDLLSYRDVLIPLNKVIEWEQNYYPAVLVGVITLIFSIIWYLEPSVLTVVCLICCICCALDFAIPTLSSRLQQMTSDSTESQDKQFDSICVRLQNAKRHAANLKHNLIVLKQNRPSAYLVIMMGLFGTLAWFGCLIDNLLLTYLIVVCAVLVPGLRKHGIVQKAVAVVKDKIASLRQQHEQKTTKAE